MQLPNKNHIVAAAERIAAYIHKTPVMTSSNLNALCAVTCFFKCENLQKVGAFKFRGATNSVLQLPEEIANQGVATHSSGNHGAALALAAKNANIPAYVVMPGNAPSVKIAAVKAYGAKVILCGSNQMAREQGLQNIVKETAASYIPPYDYFHVIAGQGTAALELQQQVQKLDAVVTPVGGGGLLAGTAIALEDICPVYGAEPEQADDAYQSFKSGKRIPLVSANTIADGLRTSLGELNFAIIKEQVADIITVTEAEIINAMQLIWQRMKIIVEPSAAVAFAMVMKDQRFQGKRVGIILTGGNVDLENLPWLS